MTKKNFWKNRRVLVTGYGGFVATHLVDGLLERGARVLVVSRRKMPVTKSANLTSTACDLKNSSKVNKIIKQHQPTTVFHLAGFSIVGEAAKNPVRVFQDNFISTLNLLDALKNQKNSQFILASSDKVYGHHTAAESEALPFLESYGLRGLDIYSSSKVCADIVCRAYAYQFKIKVAVARCCNIYGPGDINFSRLIPKNILRLLNNQSPLIKQGHENILREYLYIDDAVCAYLTVAENLDKYYGKNNLLMPGQGVETVSWPVFNFGSYSNKQLKQLKACGNIKSVNQVIKQLQKEIKFVPAKIISATPGYIEIPDEYLDSSKLQQLGYKSRVSFEEGIKKSVSWYKNNLFRFKKIAK